MGLLEDALRDTFSSQVSAPPVIDGVADRAIRQAGQVRRRRAMLVSAVTAVSVAIVGVGAVSVAEGRGPGPQIGGPPVSATSSAGPSVNPTPLPHVGAVLPVDVLNGDRIQVADGTVVSLAGMGAANRAWRVAEGWLIETYQADQQRAMVWLVSEAGGQALVASGRAAVVSPGSAARPGPQVSWLTDDQLFLGTYEDGHLSGVVSTKGVALGPQRVVGSGVVLAGTKTGGGLDTWDMWFPDRGVYTATTENRNGLSTVLGTTVDNERIIGLYGGRPPCLGELDPNGFTPAKSNCSVNLRLDDKVFPSPDGRWWAVTGEVGVAVYDAETVWTDATPLATWPSEPSTAAVWLADGTGFVVATPNAVITLYLEDGRPSDTVPLPGSGVGGTIMPIRVLR
jgi:hypothetical protein